MLAKQEGYQVDPNFIHVDWERTGEALTFVVLIAIFVERALSVVFQSHFYIERLHRSGMKETIALLVSIAVCWAWKLDVMGMVVLTETTTIQGYIVTGMIVAGGSKGSVKLFQDVMNLQSTAYKMRHTIIATRAAEDAERASESAEKAPNKAAAESEKGKAESALKRVRNAEAGAIADGKAVPSRSLEKAEAAVANAKTAVEGKEA